MRRAELELCANGEGAGAVVAEGLVERVLYALGLDLSEAWQILELLGGGLSDSCEALVEDSQSLCLFATTTSWEEGDVGLVTSRN